MELRTRDFVACILALILSQLIYNSGYGHGSSSESVSIDLSFYTDYVHSYNLPLRPRNPNDNNSDEEEIEIEIAKPVPFDLDGDGIVEGLVVPSLVNYHEENSSDGGDGGGGDSDQEWILKVLDLKPLHPSTSDGNVPIYPRAIFHSPGQKEGRTIHTVPIKIKTGSIFRNENSEVDYDEIQIGENGKPNPSLEENKRKRNYFCGKNWDDTSRCKIHCPSGLHEDCPDGEQCYADTPCDALGELNRRKVSNSSNHNESDREHEALVKTPRGGLPSIVTVWSNGDVSVHSITTDRYEGAKSKRPDLELRELWRINLIPHVINFEEIDLILSSDTVIGTYGVVIVSARYYSSKEETSDGGTLVTSFHAINAFKGDIIWSHSSDIDGGDTQQSKMHQTKQYNSNNEPVKTLSSTARRRSRGINKEREITSMTNSEDCLHHFRRWILDPSTGIFPHSYYDSNDASLVLTHFHRRPKVGQGIMPHTNSFFGTEVKTSPLRRERSNAILFHNKEGVDVLSLRNGSPLCHMSLLSKRIYVDVNNDGSIDQLQVVADNINVKPADNHISSENIDSEEGKVAEDHPTRVQHYCHASLTSGIAASEDLFQINLCQGLIKALNRKRGNDSLDMLKELGTSLARPLLVERYSGRSTIPVYDFVFALNHGSVQRIDTNGILQWDRSGPYGDIPTWHSEPGVSSGFLGSIDYDQRSTQGARIRPILIQGEDRLTVISPREGKKLASTVLPRLAVSEPILADINGDGTTDILVITKNVVLGYCVEVKTGSFLSRFVVSSILLGLGVALIFHEFGQERGRSDRATDSIQ